MREEKESYFEENDYEELMIRYEEMLRNHTTIYFDVFEFENIIDYYIDSNEQKKALMAIDIAYKQHPGSLSILLKKSQIYINNDNPVEALKILTKLRAIEPTNSEIFFLLGETYCLLGNIEAAELEFKRSLKYAYEEREEVYLNIVSILNDLNLFRLSIKFLEQAAREFPENIEIIKDKAYCYDQVEDFSSCIELYNEYLDIDPYSEDVWFRLGMIYDKIGNYNKAIEAYTFVSAINDQFSLVYYNLANTYFAVCQYKEAIDTYFKFMEFDGESPEIFCLIGECYEKLDDYNNAKCFYQKVINLDVEYSDAWFGLGIIEMELGNSMNSLKYINEAIKFDEDNTDYLYSLGRINLKLGQLKEAKLALKKAVGIDAYDFESWMLFAEIYWREKKYSKAINTLKEGYIFNSSVPEYNYKLAALYMATDDMKLAKKYFERAYSKDKDGFNLIFNYISEKQIPNEIKSIINNSLL